jgi:hypothetical protein
MILLHEQLEDLRQRVSDLIFDHPDLKIHLSYQHLDEETESIAAGSLSTFSDAMILKTYLRNFEADLINLRNHSGTPLFETGSKVVCCDAVFPDTIGEKPKRNQTYEVENVVRDFFDGTPYLILKGLKHEAPHIGYLAHKFLSVTQATEDNYKNN